MDARQKRVADNEALWREVNRSIEEAADDRVSAREEPVGFVCECGDAECNDVVYLSKSQYSAVRADPTRFFVRPGHEIPHAEQVVERGDDYIVVEKVGDAKDYVSRLDGASDDPDSV